MERRQFLMSSSLGSLAFLSPFDLLAAGKNRYEKLTILHTNDTHSHLDPFSATDKRYANQGGVNKRATIIDQIREEESNVLLLDAGDIFQGTPYFNKFGGGLELKLMSAMRYDAATMGNHDFDAGLEGFLKAKPNANFPFICSNYNFRNTVLDGQTQEYKIFKKGSLKIGVFGIGIDLEGLVPKAWYKETQVLNQIEMAQHYADKLRGEGCNLVICLSHLGYEYKSEKLSDRKLARATSEIDLIIGGHTHTFLPEPQSVENKDGKRVLVNQVGWAGLQLGRIDFFFEKQLKHKSHVLRV